MSKYAVVLEKGSPQVDLTESRAPASTGLRRAPGVRAYAELAAKLFPTSGPRRVVGFASVSRGEGVTRTVRCLTAELVHSGRAVIALDGKLRPNHTPGIIDSGDALTDAPAILGAPRAVAPETGFTLLASLRENYDCILLDCGSLEASSDLLDLAPLSDGVVLVVEADRTGKEQIERAARVIREAEGTLLGCVLNKRRYPIPEWLYRLL